MILRMRAMTVNSQFFCHDWASMMQNLHPKCYFFFLLQILTNAKLQTRVTRMLHVRTLKDLTTALVKEDLKATGELTARVRFLWRAYLIIKIRMEHSSFKKRSFHQRWNSFDNTTIFSFIYLLSFLSLSSLPKPSHSRILISFKSEFHLSLEGFSPLSFVYSRIKSLDSKETMVPRWREPKVKH